MRTRILRACFISAQLAFFVTLSSCGGDGNDNGSDTTPDSFSFLDLNNVGLDSLITSDSIKVEGIDDDVEVEISIEDGEYSIDDSNFTDQDRTVTNGQTVTVRVRSADTLYTTTSTTLTIGGVSDTFSVRTLSSGLSVNSHFKGLSFSWLPVSGAAYYRLMEKPHGDEDFHQYGSNISSASVGITMEVPIHRFDWLGAEYYLEACTTSDCSDTPPISVYSAMRRAIGYFKAGNTDTQDNFGTVALSADGKTLAIGAPGEDSDADTVNGDDGDNIASGSGATYIYVKDSNSWRLQAYIKASNSDAGDAFGTAVSLSSDGNTLAVGAPFEDGAGNSIGADDSDNAAENAGAVYVYKRSGDFWLQQGYIKASNSGAEDRFGSQVYLSYSGSTLAVGAPMEDSMSTDINGDADNDAAVDSGAVYIFDFSGELWQQQSYIKAPNTDAGDGFGNAVAFDSTGNILVVGAEGEQSNAISINGVQTDNQLDFAGAAYLYSREGSGWSFDHYVKASNTKANQRFGTSIAISSDGKTFVVGATGEASGAAGINNDELDLSAPDTGAVYVFFNDNDEWNQQAFIKASNAEPSDLFATSVALNADGSLLMVGATHEDGQAEGTDGNEADNSAADSGAVYTFERKDNEWIQIKYVKAANTNAGDGFGRFVSLDASGNSLAVGAPSEQSNTTGVDALQTNNASPGAGAAYLY